MLLVPHLPHHALLFQSLPLSPVSFGMPTSLTKFPMLQCLSQARFSHSCFLLLLFFCINLEKYIYLNLIVILLQFYQATWTCILAEWLGQCIHKSILIPYICIRIQYLSFCFWLTSLCIIGSRFIHLIRTDCVPFYGWVIFHCVYVHNFFIHSSVNGHLVCFHVLLLLLLCHFSRVQLCATPEMTAHQAPPSLGFSRQEHWSWLPLDVLNAFLSYGIFNLWWVYQAVTLSWSPDRFVVSLP